MNLVCNHESLQFRGDSYEKDSSGWSINDGLFIYNDVKMIVCVDRWESDLHERYSRKLIWLLMPKSNVQELENFEPPKYEFEVKSMF